MSKILIVKPVYNSDKLIPVGVMMFVKGDKGSLLNLSIINSKVKPFQGLTKTARKKAVERAKAAIEENFVK